MATILETLAAQQARYQESLSPVYDESHEVAGVYLGPKHRFTHAGVRLVVTSHRFPEPIGLKVHFCAEPLYNVGTPDSAAVEMFREHAVDIWRLISGETCEAVLVGQGAARSTAWHWLAPTGGGVVNQGTNRRMIILKGETR